MQRSFTFQGKRYFVYGHSKQELSDAEFKKRKELEAGARDRENPTLDDYYKTFTENRRHKVTEMTIRTEYFKFRNCADVIIDKNKTPLGKMRIRDIKPHDIQTVQNALVREGKKSVTTINDSIYHLSHVFNTAVKMELLERNPCKAIDKLKRKEKPARETNHRALSVKETKAFFEAAESSSYYNAFVVMIQTGVRVGELGAMNIFDVNNKEKILNINKTITKDEIGRYIIGSTTKTAAGTREIPLSDKALEAINRQKQYNRDVFGDTSSETLFASPEGSLLRDYSVNREIAAICKRAGIEKFTCHAFRATFATRFIEQRPQDYKILSEILGHNDVKVTLNLYTHVMKDNKIEAMRRIEIAI